MQSYESYLKDQDYSLTSITKLLYWLSRFKGWCVSKGKRVADLKESDVIMYLSERAERLNSNSLGRECTHIRSYYSYLNKDHPLSSFKLLSSSLNRSTLSYLKVTDLRLLYLSYAEGNNSLLNKVLLGLLIYQGLILNDLVSLRVNAVDELRGELLVVEGKLSERVLSLSSEQLSLLLGYCKGLKSRTSLLFSSLTKRQLSDRCYGLIKQCNRLLSSDLSLSSVRQFRSSRIRIWIEQEGLLTAQYYAGHVHLQSTQAYAVDDITALRTALEQNHPMFK